MSKKILFLLVALIIGASFFVGVQFSLAADPSITVLSPNGGETWNVGETKTVTWKIDANDSNIVIGDNVLELWSCDNSASCLYVENINNKYGSWGENSYSWKIPSVIRGIEIQPNVNYTYKIKVRMVYTDNPGTVNQTTKEISDMSDSFFTITASSQSSFADFVVTEVGVKYYALVLNEINEGNHYYAIVKNIGDDFIFTDSLVSGKNDLGIRFEGSAGWMALNNESAYYTKKQYEKGDKISKNQEIEFVAPSASRVPAGAYSIKATVNPELIGYNPKNILAEADYNNNSLTKTVAIGTPSAQPSITVLSPKGGETFKTGDNIQIKWSPSSAGVTKIQLVSSDAGVLGIYGGDLETNTTPIQSGYYNYVIPSHVNPATYYIRTTSNGKDISSNNFIITASSPNAAEITKVIPAAGKVGDMITIYGRNFKNECSGITCQIGIYFGNYYLDWETAITLRESWDNEKIVLKIPADAETGRIRVYRNETFNWGKPNAYAETVDVYGPVFKVIKNEGSNKNEDSHTIEINYNANLLGNDKMSQILAELKQLRDTVKEQATKIKYLEGLSKNMEALSAKMESAINNFITYGVDANTVKLGAGERAAVMYSYKAAFDKLPETEAELADAIRIANGRWPSATNDEAEKKAKEQFQKIYKRIADMNNANDNAAVTVMAYGLRQKAENRNLNSEKQGIKIFKGIYGHTPSSTEDWNTMQAITYSGASRGVDSDGDLLTDDREKELGTDPKNKDTDGDGYSDGAEVANGFDPLAK